MGIFLIALILSPFFLLALSASHAVCIFYLVLRALDTVEDDMSIPLEKKVPLLHHFHTFLYQPDWCFTESKEKDRQVLEDFPSVIHTDFTYCIPVKLSTTEECAESLKKKT